MILDKLADHARERVAAAKVQTPVEVLRARAQAMPRGGFAFEKALQKDELGLICEIKKASPSKGIIDEQFDYIGIAGQYEEAGADCTSVLTEPKWFLGSNDVFRTVRLHVDTPLIRKDFTVDAYQLYEAKCMGADAALLICALLDTKTLSQYLEICDELGLSALVEAHDANEVQSAVAAGARLIGVNNRNLKDFSVDLDNAVRLRETIPPEVLYVAESGVSAPEDARVLRQAGADAVLVGEYLMRALDKESAMHALREAARCG